MSVVVVSGVFVNKFMLVPHKKRVHFRHMSTGRNPPRKVERRGGGDPTQGVEVPGSTNGLEVGSVGREFDVLPPLLFPLEGRENSYGGPSRNV